MEMYNPPHPGEVIRESCIDALVLSVTDAAKALGVTRKSLSELLNGKAGLSPIMAIRLEQVFGGTADAWVRLQAQYDLWQAREKTKTLKLKRLKAAG
jgi:addiction module HigA family antidote